MNEPKTSLRKTTRHVLDYGAPFALLLFAIAWPWEIYQRLPLVHVTVAKLAAAAVILFAVLRIARRQIGHLPRTGLEAPLALLAVASVASATHSVDTSASFTHLRQLASYGLLFYAVVLLVPRTDDAAYVTCAFAASVFVVGLVALACSAGLLTPTKAAAIRELGHRVTSEMRAGALIRMAATTPDYNQGVLAFLMAIPMAVFLFRPRALRWTTGLAVVVCMAGIVTAFSRSAMAAALLILFAFAVPPVETSSTP